MLSGTGITPWFPLWRSSTHTRPRAQDVLRNGLRTTLTCMDLEQLLAVFVGRPYDEALLSNLLPQVAPCGERGEFHSFFFARPMFVCEIAVRLGYVISRDGFCFVDILEILPSH